MNGEAKILSILETLVNDVSGLKQDVEMLKGIVIRMENEHGQKLGAFFDSYQLNLDLNNRNAKRISVLEKGFEKLSLEVVFKKSQVVRTPENP